MKIMNIKEFPSEYLKMINLLNSFWGSLENWSVEEYIKQCEELIHCLINANEDEIKNLELTCVCNQDLLDMKKCLEREDNEKQMHYFTELVYHSYAFKSKISFEDDLYIEQLNEILKKMEDYYFENLKKQEKYYYKDLFEKEYYEKYEKMLCFIRDYLQLYEMNLVYCRKIVDFLINEFNEKGIFVAQTIFLKNYLNNAIDSMILTICKLVLDNPNLSSKKNFGMRYLHSYIGKNLDKDVKKSVSVKLSNAHKKITDVKKKTIELENLRNSLIAHFDIEEIDNVKQIKMGIEEFESVFDILCEILELLSINLATSPFTGYVGVAAC